MEAKKYNITKDGISGLQLLKIATKSDQIFYKNKNSKNG